MSNANEKFKQLMFEIGMNYQKPLNDDQIKFFAMQAKRFGFTKFDDAIRKHMEDPDKGQFMPKIADIVANIEGTKKENNQHLEGTAQMQWQNVTRAISEVGSYRTPNFKDPITRACVSSMGGWQLLCSQTVDQLVWKGKEFVQMYQDYTRRPIDQLPDHVAGAEDIQKLKGESAATMAHLTDKMNEIFGLE